MGFWKAQHDPHPALACCALRNGMPQDSTQRGPSSLGHDSSSSLSWHSNSYVTFFHLRLLGIFASPQPSSRSLEPCGSRGRTLISDTSTFTSESSSCSSAVASSCNSVCSGSNVFCTFTFSVALVFVDTTRRFVYVRVLSAPDSIAPSAAIQPPSSVRLLSSSQPWPGNYSFPSLRLSYHLCWSACLQARPSLCPHLSVGVQVRQLQLLLP